MLLGGAPHSNTPSKHASNQLPSWQSIICPAHAEVHAANSLWSQSAQKICGFVELCILFATHSKNAHAHPLSLSRNVPLSVVFKVLAKQSFPTCSGTCRSTRPCHERWENFYHVQGSIQTVQTTSSYYLLLMVVGQFCSSGILVPNA